MKRETDLGALAWGVFFVAAGVAFLLDAVGVADLDAGLVWPVILIALGCATISRGVEVERSRDTGARRPGMRH